MATDRAVQAHRGSPDPAAGIRREHPRRPSPGPAELGADGVELDVRLTADGALAVHHDPVVAGVGAVAELAAADLPAARAAPGRGAGRLRGHGREHRDQEPARPSPASTPTERAAGRGGRAGRAERAVRRPVVVSSFWPGALAAVRSAGSDPRHRTAGGPPVRPVAARRRPRSRPRLLRRPPPTRPLVTADRWPPPTPPDWPSRPGRSTTRRPAAVARPRGRHGDHRRRAGPGRSEVPSSVGHGSVHTDRGRRPAARPGGSAGRSSADGGRPDLGRRPDWSKGPVFVNNARP